MKPKKAPEAEKKDPALSWKIEGWGKTVEDAEKHMLSKATARVASHLRTLEPPILWTPPADYVRKSFLTGQPERCLDQEKVQINDEQLQCWSWTIGLTSAQLNSIRREDDKFRARLAVEDRAGVAQTRMLEMGKLLGMAVLALGGLSLYFRMERIAASSGRWQARGSLKWILVAAVIALLGMSVTKSVNYSSHQVLKSERPSEVQNK